MERIISPELTIEKLQIARSLIKRMAPPAYVDTIYNEADQAVIRIDNREADNYWRVSEFSVFDVGTAMVIAKVKNQKYPKHGVKVYAKDYSLVYSYGVTDDEPYLDGGTFDVPIEIVFWPESGFIGPHNPGPTYPIKCEAVRALSANGTPIVHIYTTYGRLKDGEITQEDRMLSATFTAEEFHVLQYYISQM